MAFFTRKGLTVPDFPSETVLAEEPEDFVLPPPPPMMLPPSTSPIAAHRNESNKIAPKYVAPPAHVDSVSAAFNCSSNVKPPQNSTSVTPVFLTTSVSTTTAAKTDDDDDQSHFEYVVDRTYGVEV